MIRLHLVVGAILLVWSTRCNAQTGSVAVGDSRIYHEVAGTGTSVVFIHGWANDARAWDDQFDVFAKAFRAIRYDRRGFGRSTAVPDLTADPMDLKVLLDSLGVSTAHLVGHSAGARLALAFALAFPERVRGLVLYSSGPPSGFAMSPEEAAGLASMPAIAGRHGLDSLGKFVMAMPAFHVPTERADVRRRIAAIWSAYSGRDLLEDYPLFGRTALASVDQLASVNAPTLIVVGDSDGALFHRIADTLAVRISGARRVTLPGGGHVVHMLQPARFNDAVVAFLAEVDHRQ